MKNLAIILLLTGISLHANCQQMKFNWISQIGGPGWDVVTDIVELPEGHLAIAGAFYESIGCQSDTLQSKGSRDIFIAIFNTDGNLEKLTSIGGEGFDYAKKIEATKNGLIVPVRFNYTTEIFDHTFENNFANNILITWLDKELNLTNDLLISGSKEFDITEIKSLPDGSCIFSGWFSDTLRIEDQIYISKGGKDSFIGKLSSKGEQQWFKHIKGDEDDLITSLTSNEAGDTFYFCGTTDKGCFPGVEIPQTTEGGQKYLFIAEVGEKGEMINFKYVLSGTDIVPLEIIDDSMSIWVLANFKNNVTIDEKQKIPAQGKSNALLFKFNFSDSISVHFRIGGQGNIQANQLVRSGKRLMITGQYSGKVIFGATTVESATKGTDIFIALIDDNCTPSEIFSFTGENNEFPCSAFATKSGVFVTGEFKEKMKVENTELLSAGKEDIFLARIENCSDKNSPSIEVNILGENEDETVWELDAGPEFLTYIWNDGLSSSRYLITNQTGDYNVMVKDFFGCSYSSGINLVTEKSSQIKPDAVAVRFKVYPTVTPDFVYWEPATTWENLPATVSVFDSLGRKISQQKLERIKPQVYSVNLSGETNGTYLLKISGEGFHEISKVTLKK